MPGIPTLVRAGAIAAMSIAAVLFTWQSLSQLRGVRDGIPGDTAGLQLATAAFVLTVLVVLLVEVVCLGRRLTGPEQQVRRAMQRIRAGDVGFRVPLRRGEPLSRLVHECNGMLEWLNRNPPKGVRVDEDVFDLPVEQLEEERL